MFKKRIRVAKVAFLTILVLTVLVVCFWKVSEKNSKGTRELKGIVGTAEAAEGVAVHIGTVERVWQNDDDWLERTNLDENATYFYKMRTAKITGNNAVTGLTYEKQTVSEQRYRMFFWKLMPDFSQQHLQGMHTVKGSEFSFDLEWYLSDGYSYSGDEMYRVEDYVTLAEEETFLYYYDGLGPDCYEAAPFSLYEGKSYNGSNLCELDGALYGYLGMEPKVGYNCTYSYSGQREESMGDTSVSASTTIGTWDYETTCEVIDNRDFAEALSEFGEQSLHLAIKKGIYRFGEDGNADCVIELGTYGDGFSFLWLVAKEEENTLTVIGTKENRLITYIYHMGTGTVEERILWDAGEEPDEFVEWFYETASRYILADMVTEGELSYLCCTAIYDSPVNLTIFEDGNRIFAGDVLQPELGVDSLNFSMNVNASPWASSVVDKVEIILMNREK